MDGLHCRRNLGVRGREQAGDLLGQCLVGGESGKLALPKVEISPGQPVEIGTGSVGLFVVFRGHVFTIAYRLTNAAFADANPILSHCGISANVTCPK
ncbi:MAG: hypothetical protein HYZ40_13065 [Rhodospirillales bacterium]|nr:hypothetical protein [Rhodospirillales bacterium]